MLQREIITENDIVTNNSGTQKINPKHILLETLSRRSVALSRMLHIHAEATVGRAGDQAKRNKKQRELQESKKNADPLFAQPIQLGKK